MLGEYYIINGKRYSSREVVSILRHVALGILFLGVPLFFALGIVIGSVIDSGLSGSPLIVYMPKPVHSESLVDSRCREKFLKLWDESKATAEQKSVMIEDASGFVDSSSVTWCKVGFKVKSDSLVWIDTYWSKFYNDDGDGSAELEPVSSDAYQEAWLQQL